MGNGSLSNVLATHVWRPKLRSSTAMGERSQAWRHEFVIPTQGRRRQEDSWKLLARQFVVKSVSSGLSERLCLKKITENNGERHPALSTRLHTRVYTRVKTPKKKDT